MIDLKVHQHVYWEGKDKFLLDEDKDAHWIMYIIEDGEFYFEINNKNGYAKKGDIVICPPYENFKRKVISSLSFHFIRLSIESAYFDNYIPIGKIQLEYDERFYKNCKLLNKLSFTDTKEVNSIRTHLVKDFFYMYWINNIYINPINLSKGVRDEVILKALDCLDNIKNQDISLELLAKNLGINPSYFSRKFKQVIGVTPSIYRTKVKLQYAQSLLINTNKTIDTVAIDSGFNNGFYLSKTFSKYFGMTPSQYRKLHVV